MAVHRTPITMQFGSAGVRAASVAPVTYDAKTGEIDVTWFADPDAVLRNGLATLRVAW